MYTVGYGIIPLWPQKQNVVYVTTTGRIFRQIVVEHVALFGATLDYKC